MSNTLVYTSLTLPNISPGAPDQKQGGEWKHVIRNGVRRARRVATFGLIGLQRTNKAKTASVIASKNDAVPRAGAHQRQTNVLMPQPGERYERAISAARTPSRPSPLDVPLDAPHVDNNAAVVPSPHIHRYSIPKVDLGIDDLESSSSGYGSEYEWDAASYCDDNAPQESRWEPLAASSALPVSEIIATRIATITDQETRRPALIGPGDEQMPREPTVDEADAVRTATQSLIAKCRYDNIDDRPASAPPLDEPWLPAAPTLFRRGADLYREIFGPQDGDWAGRVARAVALATSSLASSASADDIEQYFVRHAMGYAIDPEGYGHKPELPDWDPLNKLHDPNAGPREKAICTEVLASIAQLRLAGSPQRQKLNVALDKALPSDGGDRVREIAGGILDLMSTLAAQKLGRQYCNFAVSELLKAFNLSDRTGIAISLAALYRFDRQWGSPYQSGADRWLSIIQHLPASSRKDFLDIWGSVDKRDVLDERRHDEHGNPRGVLTNGMLDFVAAPGGAPHQAEDAPTFDPTDLKRNEQNSSYLYSQDNNWDKKSFLNDLIDAKTAVDGSMIGAYDIPDSALINATSDAFPFMRHAEKPGMFRTAIRRLRALFSLSPGQRARRHILQAIKIQAADKNLGTKQRTALERARHDLGNTPNGHALYTRTVQACLAELHPQKCGALALSVNMALETDSDPALRTHMIALDEALTREPAVRKAVDIIGTYLQAQSKTRDSAFIQTEALHRLWTVLDKYRSDTALEIGREALDRLSGQSGKMRKAAESFQDPVKRQDIKRVIFDTLIQDMPADYARDHKMRLLPLFNMLAALLEEKQLNR